MGPPRRGKGLPHAALLQKRGKRLGRVLLEGQPLRPLYILKRLSKRRRGKICVGDFGKILEALYIPTLPAAAGDTGHVWTSTLPLANAY